MAHNMPVPVFMGEGRLEMQERPTPQIKNPDDVRLRVEACGLCGTDLNILAVPPAHKAEVGTVLGHEFVGTVEAVGAGVKYVREGDRVVVAPRLHCNQCRYCRRGLANQCENYKTLGIHRDGGLAPYVVAPERALYKISRDVALDDVVFAEGLPAETYLDAGDRANFANGVGATRLFADFSARALDACVLREAYSCAPLIVFGPDLEAARRRVNAIADSVARTTVGVAA